MTALTAHAGCEHTPLSSLESVLVGISAGADCVEVDVRLGPDGVLVLSHDKLASYENAVTLEEVFQAAVEAEVSVNCDLKEPSALYPTLALAEKCGMPAHKLIFSGSVSCDLLAADPAINGRCRVYLNIEELLKYLMGCPSGNLAEQMNNPWKGIYLHASEIIAEYFDAVVTALRSLGVFALNLPFEPLTDENIDALQRAGLRLSLWTPCEEQDLRRLLDAGVYNITSREIKRALAMRG